MGEGLNFRFAHTLTGRLFGLTRKSVCVQGEVLVLLPCRSIHTFGMKEDIDVAFFDSRGRVMKAVRALPPRRFCSCRGAAGVLERRSARGAFWFESGDSVKLIN